MNAAEWTTGNRLHLLENGEEFFPAVFDAIRNARSEVLLETFIWFDDPVGRALKDALVEAGSRGAQVDVTADAYGSPDLSDAFLAELAQAGVRFHYFDPRPRILGMRTNALRRLHRKLVSVDRKLAFIGGINYSEDQMAGGGPLAKQDYAVRVEGPLALSIRSLMLAELQGRSLPRGRGWRVTSLRGSQNPSEATQASATLIWRDNKHHRDDIELHYRAAVRAAQHDVLIANAYFFPGYRLLRELRLAAARGVRVRLLLQGMPDRPLMAWAARTLYDFLLIRGVSIHEYCERPFHGKVAVVDDEWATVGSSNLDPTSLSLNLEANLVAKDGDLNRALRERLERLLRDQCRQVDPSQAQRRTAWQQLFSYVVFHVVRRFPRWIGWLPSRQQRLVRARTGDEEEEQRQAS